MGLGINSDSIWLFVVVKTLFMVRNELHFFLDHAFSIMKTKINQQNAQINSGLIYY